MSPTPNISLIENSVVLSDLTAPFLFYTLEVGIGESSKIVLLFIGTFFQLVLLIMDDARSVPKEYFNAAYTLGASTREVIFRVLIPSILPQVFNDLRIVLGWCWTYLLIGELVAAKTGIGFMIQQAQRYARPEAVMAGILVIGLIGLFSDSLMRLWHKHLFPYLRT